MAEQATHDLDALRDAIIKSGHLAYVEGTGGGCLAVIVGDAQNRKGDLVGPVAVVTELDGPWVISAHPSLNEWWDCDGSHAEHDPDEVAPDTMVDAEAFPLIIAKIDAILANPPTRATVANLGDAKISERIREAVGLADVAFWNVIADKFPEITTGDFGPGETIALERAQIEAVETWLANNADDEDEDEEDAPRAEDAHLEAAYEDAQNGGGDVDL